MGPGHPNLGRDDAVAVMQRFDPGAEIGEAFDEALQQLADIGRAVDGLAEGHHFVARGVEGLDRRLDVLAVLGVGMGADDRLAAGAEIERDRIGHERLRSVVASTRHRPDRMSAAYLLCSAARALLITPRYEEAGMAAGILLGKAGTAPVELLARMATRHGLIAGATGTGKTVTLRVIAEQMSRQGVPCFVADVKG